MNEYRGKTIGRLENGKYKTALLYAEKAGITGFTLASIEALSRLFGNTGAVDGDMGYVLSLAVETLVRDIKREGES